MCIYRKAFVFKPISNQLNILANKSLNSSFFEMDG